MEEAKKLRQKDSRLGALGRISQKELFEALDALLFAKSSSIKEIKEAYQRAIESKTNGHKHGDNMISEREALQLLALFVVNRRSLRSWGFKEGVCNIENDNKGKRYFFRKSAIEGLAKAYLPLREARKKFKGSRPQFYRKIKGCQKIIIGNQTLILRDDLLEIFINASANPKAEAVQLKSA